MQNTLSTKKTKLSLSSLLSKNSQLHQSVLKTCEKSPNPYHVLGLKGSLSAFFIEQFISAKNNELLQFSYSGHPKSFKNDYVIIVSGQKEADECESDLQTVLGDSVEILQFPWWQTLPYRTQAKGSEIFGLRAGVLSKLSYKNPVSSKDRIFIVSQRSFISPIPSPEYTKSISFRITKGQQLDSTELAEKLSKMGYIRVPKVGVKGEFALRGEVLDVYLGQEKEPNRIVFDFDTIDQIKTFDNETQSSTSNLNSLIIYPMKEVLWTDELVEKLDKILTDEDSQGIQNNFAEYDEAKHSGAVVEKVEFEESENDFPENKAVHLAFTKEAKERKENLVTELSVSKESVGEELFYGCLWDKYYSLKDYFSEDTNVFVYDFDRLFNAQKLIENEFNVSYRTERQHLPILEPSKMLLNFENLLEKIQNSVYFRTLENLETQEQISVNSENIIKINCEPSQSYFGNVNYLKEQLIEMQNNGYHIFVYADNPNQALRVNEILKDFVEISDKTLHPLEVLGLSLSEGFSIADEKILVIQENEIFGRKKNAPKSTRNVKSKTIDTFVELNPGDYIVHVNYGIGLFKGIERIKSMGTERDYIKLEYADQEFVFVPIEQVNMVSRYIGNENERPKMDRIGSKSWSARKAKVQEKVQEIAEKLIDLYSKRQASRGFPFPKDNEWNAAFEAAFPYEDTPDQATATREIKEDMEKPLPMDRLVCGDVGYGKTEIALRAAFKAVMGGKQVAILAPTTILAEQHYENAVERFKNFPVTIAQLSRFVSPAEQKKVIEKLAEGKIDVVIGTHRVIQKDVVFKDLGLMIIDEEQRFGVKDKERLKTIKTNIDSLALSATPIPRTLHMSLLKIRDMSLLTTPPQNRHPIETVIDSYDDEKVARAIRSEVNRGGQVFYLHNRVESLEETRFKLQKLCPEMMIDIAHGQMTSDQLDDIFRRFKMGGFHVLVATTIIENGIDIPNVNTIIIDRADMYGVSQLYQLRGRVGRSDKKAYAYLFYPENKALSEVAMKRLQVISDFTELGSGFKIAMKDMEIRGAGNLLGKDQSGEVYAVGFEMYLSLLNQAIERLSNSDWHAPDEVLLELDYSGFIPDSYIKDAETKMEMYKKIASIQNDEELNGIWNEMFDRFGPIPEEVSSLLSLAKIRIICNKLSIKSLKEKKGIVRVEFGQVQKISIDKLLKLIKVSGGTVKLDNAAPNQIILTTPSISLKEKCDFIKEKLEQLL